MGFQQNTHDEHAHLMNTWSLDISRNFRQNDGYVQATFGRTLEGTIRKDGELTSDNVNT